MARKRKEEQPVEPQSVEDRIGTVDVADELEAAFLEYSLSVLVSRAIPDAADGLKPCLLYTSDAADE